jgi:hypothetical protein
MSAVHLLVCITFVLGSFDIRTSNDTVLIDLFADVGVQGGCVVLEARCGVVGGTRAVECEEVLFD